MPRNQRSGRHREQRWKDKSNADGKLSTVADTAATAAETVTDRLAGMHIAESSEQTSVPAATMHIGGVQPANQGGVQESKANWKPKAFGAASGVTTAEVENTQADVASTGKSSTGLSKLFCSNLLENFTVDNSTYSRAQIRATFYPKFENEKTDQEKFSSDYTEVLSWMKESESF